MLYATRMQHENHTFYTVLLQFQCAQFWNKPHRSEYNINKERYKEKRMGRDIKKCHPRLQEAFQQLLAKCSARGLTVGLGECFRTVAEQDALYAQGRTESGSIVTYAKGSSYASQHQWGIAFDFYRNDGKGAYNDSDHFFQRVGEVGKSLGLGWGGDWTSIVDKPHFYLPDWGSGTKILRKQYGTFEHFKKTWEGMKMDYTYMPISTGNDKVKVTASSLIIRKEPGGEDTGSRYHRGERIAPIEKAVYASERWFRTKRGWLSADYLRGWILEDNQWWYIEPGYSYPKGCLKLIDGKCYSFDFNGWMLTADRIRSDGEIV